MNDIDSTPLGQFRKKTVITTLALIVISVVFVIIAVSVQSDAQSNYSEYLRITSTYEFLDGSDYLDKYNNATSTATFCIGVSALAISAAVVSGIAWIGTNLLIANKRTILAVQKAIDTPMELEACTGAVDAPIGSSITFQEEGDTLVATNLVGEPVGALNKEFADRIKAAEQNKTAKAYVTSYRSNHPVIEVTANAQTLLSGASFGLPLSINVITRIAHHLSQIKSLHVIWTASTTVPSNQPPCPLRSYRALRLIFRRHLKCVILYNRSAKSPFISAISTSISKLFVRTNSINYNGIDKTIRSGEGFRNVDHEGSCRATRHHPAQGARAHKKRST